jgi:hypothetical protein
MERNVQTFMTTNNKSRRTLLCRNSLLFALLVLSASVSAWAHIGSPYPILENRKLGPYNVSLWSNPDVGTGSFFVMIDPPPGASVPDDIKIAIAVQPVSGRLPEATYAAWREKVRNRVEYKTDVPFDKEEEWRVRVILASARGGGETSTNVQVTPPGLGRWELLLFLLPFLGIGFLWFKAAATKREQRRRKKPMNVQVFRNES